VLYIYIYIYIYICDISRLRVKIIENFTNLIETLITLIQSVRGKEHCSTFKFLVLNGL